MRMRLLTPRLIIEIAEPGRDYLGTRFDWTGRITQVTLDHRHRFCTVESTPVEAGTGGSGLCNEFGIGDPPGYGDARPGQRFLKPGVGLLLRPDDQPYSFAREYPLQPFPIRTTVQPNRITFLVEPVDCRGYAVRLIKTITAHDDQLQIDYRLENVGYRPIRTDEYCHNFLAINDRGPGPDYRLRTPFALTDGCRHPSFALQGPEMRWPQPPRRAFHAVFAPLPPSQDHWWELVHEATGVGVREITSLPWRKLAIFGTPRLLSPEAFVGIDLLPGQHQTWSRQFVFFARGTPETRRQ